LFVVFSANGFAATVFVGVYCGGGAPFTGKTVVTTPPISEVMSCDSSSASVYAPSADVVSVGSSGSAQATYDSVVQVTFSGGAGDARYVPCLNLGYGSSGGSGAFFGPVDLGSKFPAGGTCFSPLVLTSGIPFTFGVPQLQRVFLEASSVGPLGFGAASLNGFVVLDAAGNRISNATWTAVDVQVPEPGTFVPVSMAFALAGLLFRRVRAGRLR
jgi:hypothetical protein